MGTGVSLGRSRSILVAALASIALFGMTGCAPEIVDAPPPPTTAPTAPTTPAEVTPSPTPTPAAEPTVTMVSVTDGDTIKTNEGMVRIIGIDTPERGECGHNEASDALSDVLAYGDPLVLDLPADQNNRDKYDRLLRHVSTVDGDDLGLLQVKAGHAVARYDSLDGYPKHAFEAQYHAAQTASFGPDGRVQTAVCKAEADASKAPAPPADSPAETSDAGASWFTEYRSCAALKRNGVGHPTGPFNRDDPAQAEIYDWFQYGTGFRGDGDGDGFACE